MVPKQSLFGTSQKHTEPDNFCRQAAEQLYTTLRENRKLLGRKTRLSTWVVEIDRLHKSDRISQERITAAILWLGEHCRDPYTPQIHSGSSFRRKFLSIESAMQRKPIPRNLTIGPAARDLAIEIGRLGWPQVPQTLPQAVQQSLTSYTNWSRAVLRYTKRAPRRSFAVYVLNHFGSTDHFVREWFRVLCERTAHWDDWDGSTIQHAFRPDHGLFTGRGRALAQQFCGAADRWHSFLEEVAREG